MNPEKIILLPNSRWQQTILHTAVKMKNLDLVGLLIKREDVAKELVKITDTAGQIALHLAAALGEFDICKALLEPSISAQVFTSQTTDNKYTVLHLAVHAKQSKIVHLFVEKLQQGEDFLGAVDKHGQTALHWAAGTDCYEISKILYDKMSVEQICTEMDFAGRKQTALHFAVQGKSQKIVELLLTREEASQRLPGLKDISGFTALDWARKQNCYEIIVSLLEKQT